MIKFLVTILFTISIYKIKKKLQDVFKSFLPDIVIHFAGLKNATESIENPLLYYKENILSTINLLEIMELFKCKNLVFSSSATVYGYNSKNKISEKAQTKPLTPYGESKLINEKIIFDWVQKFNTSAIILRYFNPIGADSSSIIGEDPIHPINLMNNISQTYLQKKEKLFIFGNNYNTSDGTPLRDFIHVSDLSKAHIKASDFLTNKRKYFDMFNVGTGKGATVLQLINTFEKCAGSSIPFTFSAPRQNDIIQSIADVKKIKKVLNWEAKFNLIDMCETTISWLKNKNKLFS